MFPKWVEYCSNGANVSGKSWFNHFSYRIIACRSQLNCASFSLSLSIYPDQVQDKTQRRLVKESFIIEAPEGRRKLRHLFLFNDTIVCAKYKPSTRSIIYFPLTSFSRFSSLKTIPFLIHFFLLVCSQAKIHLRCQMVCSSLWYNTAWSWRWEKIIITMRTLRTTL